MARPQPPGTRGRAVAWLRGRWQREVDLLAGSDPGLNRLRLAVRGLAAVAAGMLGEYVFVELTGALQLAGPAARTATGRAADHDTLLVALLIGALVGLMTALGVNEARPIDDAFWSLLVPAPMAATLVLGLALAPDRALALASFPALLGLAGLLRRWGPRGTAFGQPLFVGDFLGFFLGGEVALGRVGWLVAEVGVASLVGVLVRLVVFRPDATASLQRAQRAWVGQARHVARLAADAMDRPDRRDEAALRRALGRLNEASLVVDAHLADPAALPVGSSARLLHERLFEAELGVTNAARFAVALAGADLPAAARQGTEGALHALAEGRVEDAAAAAHAILDDLARTEPGESDLPGNEVGGPIRRRRVLLHRLAMSVALVGDALEEWLRLGERPVRAAAIAAGGGGDAVRPAVRLVSNALPGSADASTAASRMPRYVRSAVHLALAVALGTVIGDAISPRRFYWAVIAAFVALTGTNTDLEQVRKAVARVAGTVVGILLGSLVATAVGTRPVGSLAVIFVALFVGLYLFRVSYVAMVVAITVMVSQLYEELHELTAALLGLRLLETGIGAGAAVAVVLTVLPLRTTRVVVVATDALLDAVAAVVADSASALSGPVPAARLIAGARAVDAAFQGLAASASPLRHLGEAGRRAQRLVVIAGALRHYCRNLTTDLRGVSEAEGPTHEIAARATRSMLAGIDVLRHPAGDDGAYVRTAALWSVVEQRALDRLRSSVDSGGRTGEAVAGIMLAARDFQLLDGALADLAALRGIDVLALDSDLEAGGAGALTGGRPQRGPEGPAQG